MGEASHPGPPNIEFDDARTILINLGVGVPVGIPPVNNVNDVVDVSEDVGHVFPCPSVSPVHDDANDFSTPIQSPRRSLPASPLLGSLSPGVRGLVRHTPARPDAHNLDEWHIAQFASALTPCSRVSDDVNLRVGGLLSSNLNDFPDADVIVATADTLPPSQWNISQFASAVSPNDLGSPELIPVSVHDDVPPLTRDGTPAAMYVHTPFVETEVALRNELINCGLLDVSAPLLVADVVVVDVPVVDTAFMHDLFNDPILEHDEAGGFAAAPHGEPNILGPFIVDWCRTHSHPGP